MKMAIASSIALACLLAGADAFGSMPKPGPATCDGHTGNLAVLAALGSSCDNIAHGHDPTPGLLSCENADGSDNLHNIGPGVDLDLKALCPEKCGHHPGSIPCGHAPEVDINAIGANWGLNNCADVRADARGLCESDMLANWFCGESCRGGAPWDECMWHKSARQQIDQDCAKEGFPAAYGYTDAEACEADGVANYIGTSGYTKAAQQQIADDCAKEGFPAAYGYTGPEACEADGVANYIGTSGYTKTAQQQIADDCAKEGFPAAYGYSGPEACEADGVANWIVDSTSGTCPGDTSGTGADCYKGQPIEACPGDTSGADCYYDSNLFAHGSTQVAQCPGELDPFRRRKLTRSGTHSGAMKTKGVFTLTASGSK